MYLGKEGEAGQVLPVRLGRGQAGAMMQLWHPIQNGRLYQSQGSRKTAVGTRAEGTTEYRRVEGEQARHSASGLA